MPQHDPLPPALDLTALTFPSDRITIADLRRAHLDLFDGPDAKRFGSAALLDLDTVLFVERLLARAAFAKAQGKAVDVLRDETLLEREDFVADLARFYRIYGVSKGLQHTEQLVRTFESQAAAQARRGR